MSRKNIAEVNSFSKDFPLNIKNNISTLNNFHKLKYEDIKNTSNKDEKNKDYNMNNIFSINDQNKFINIKQNLISTNMNNINIYSNSPKIMQKQSRSNHFNKTYKNNNNCGMNKNNMYIKYYNEYQNNDTNNLLLDKSKGDNNNNFYNNNKEDYINNIINVNNNDSLEDGFNDNYYDHNGSMKSDDDDEPDPRINFEHINQINKSRPLTSYGGLNARRKNLQSALQKNKNRPITSCNNNLPF